MCEEHTEPYILPSFCAPPPKISICFLFSFDVFFRATAPELHYTVYEYQLSAADKDHGNLLKANQVRSTGYSCRTQIFMVTFTQPYFVLCHVCIKYPFNVGPTQTKYL